MKAIYLLKCIGAGMGIGCIFGILAASITIMFVKTSDIYILYFLYPLILGTIGLITGLISSLITKKINNVLTSISVVCGILFFAYLILFKWAFSL